MGMLDHWHPVHPSRTLAKGKLSEVTLAGKRICLFRKSDGSVGAIDNICPHRRMLLSYGKVVNDRVQCKYHGWTYDACGNGESPAAPKLHTCTDSFDTREEYGSIWIKSQSSTPVFPELDIKGFHHIGNFEHEVPAPLELTVDNFNEIEHSGTVHDTFGYDLDRLSEVQVQFEQTDDSVTVRNVGPSKRLFKPYAWFLGIKKDTLFHDHWTTRFSPVYSVFDHWWTSPDMKKEAMFRWRVYIFFCPVSPDKTIARSFIYAKGRYPGVAGGILVARYFMRREADKEIRQDITMLEHMGDKNPDITGMKLSRFDRILGMTRERIERIYRGKTANSRIPLAS